MAATANQRTALFPDPSTGNPRVAFQYWLLRLSLWRVQVPKMTWRWNQIVPIAYLGLVTQGVAATWSHLDCFGLKWAFSLAHSPYPLSEMVRAGEQPWGVGGGKIWFGAETGSRTLVSLIFSPEGGQEEPGGPVPHLVIWSPWWCAPQCSLVSSSCLFFQASAGLIEPCPNWLTGSCVQMRSVAVRDRGQGEGAEGLDC